MEHYFELIVKHRNEDQLFKGRLVTFMYEYKFYININNQEFIFEYDDMGDLRAIASKNSNPMIEKDLIELIVKEIKKLYPI